MEDAKIFRVALASPSDVQPERDLVQPVLDDLNSMLRTTGRRMHLALWRWETDARPGLHLLGPQGLIDDSLRIEDSDVLIGIFWKRLGTPTRDSGSGTEHEIRTAIRAWKRKGSPQVMLYFSEVAFRPGETDPEQFQRLQAFKSDLLSSDEPLVWPYTDLAEFRTSLQIHLWKEVWTQAESPPSVPSGSYPLFPPLAVAVTTNALTVRAEGLTERVGDIFLTCTYLGDSLPIPYSLWLTVIISFGTVVTSRLTPTIDEIRTSDATLLKVDGPFTKPVLHGIVYANCVIFHSLDLNDMKPNEKRTFQITNIRANASILRAPQMMYGSVYLNGAILARTLHSLAKVRRGLCFEVRDASSFSTLADVFAAPQSVDLPLRQIVTLRFSEGFNGAFKTKDEESAPPGANCPLSAAANGVSGASSWADHGTRLRARFCSIPYGVRLFVSATQLRSSLGVGAQLVEAESRIMTDAHPMTVGDVEVVELRMESEPFSWGVTAVWEIVQSNSAASLGCADFGVYASFTANPTERCPYLGRGTVNGSFAPTAVESFSPMAGVVASATLPIPRFSVDTPMPIPIIEIAPK